MLENESVEERDKRRKAALVHFVAKLPSSMADKATNMYRQGSRQKKTEG